MNDFRAIRALRKWLKEMTTKPKEALFKEDVDRVPKVYEFERKLTYKYDFAAFCLEVLDAESYGEPPQKWGQVHYDLCRFIRRCRNLGKCAFIQLPRHHLKTHIVTVFYRIWRFIHDPDLCSLVVSGTLGLSKDSVTLMKGILMSNKNLHRRYPHVVSERLWRDKMNKWSEAAFNVHREKSHPQCTIEAVGVGATVTGKHFGEIDFDDLVTPENCTTQEQCQKVINAYRYYLSIVNPARTPGKIPFVVVGTPYEDGDLYTFLKEDPEIFKKFLCFIRPLYDSRRALIWSPPFTEEVVAEIRANQGPYMFAAQYLLDPVPPEMMEFKRNWILTYSALPSDLNGNEISLKRYIIVDPVTMKKTDSDSKARGVILVLGVDKGGTWYALDYQLYDRAKEGTMFDGIFMMCERHHVFTVGWESVAYQAQGVHNLEEESERRKIKISVKKLYPGHRDKDTRIRALIPYFERGQILIKGWMSELLHELLRFPKGQTKDIIDALAYFPQFVKKRKLLGSSNAIWNTQHAQKPFYL